MSQHSRPTSPTAAVVRFFFFFYSLTTPRVCVALASINERPEFKLKKKTTKISNQIKLARIESTLDDAHCELCLKQSKVQVVVVVVVQCETMSAAGPLAAAGLSQCPVESVMSFWLEAGATTEELLRSVCRQNSFFPFSLHPQEVLPTFWESSLLASECSLVCVCVCVKKRIVCV